MACLEICLGAPTMETAKSADRVQHVLFCVVFIYAQSSPQIPCLRSQLLIHIILDLVQCINASSLTTSIQFYVIMCLNTVGLIYSPLQSLVVLQIRYSPNVHLRIHRHVWTLVLSVTVPALQHVSVMMASSGTMVHVFQ